MKLPLLLAALACLSLRMEAAEPFWLDLYNGEPVPQEIVVEDLKTADVIYLGEVHTIERHHQMQADLLKELAEGGQRPMALGLEQLEARDQPAVDRFNRGELDFNQLADAIGWDKKWKNYEQYRSLCETAQKNSIALKGLNAPAEIIRQVSRGGGLAKLDTDLRSQLPPEIVTDDPQYEKLMNLMLSVHASMDPEKLRPVFEAQVARDETMASNIAAAAEGGKLVVVVCGRGHINYGLGTPARVRRHLPNHKERILLATESGELKMTPEEKAMARKISITHEDLRALGRPLADYTQIVPRKTNEP